MQVQAKHWLSDSSHPSGASDRMARYDGFPALTEHQGLSRRLVLALGLAKLFGVGLAAILARFHDVDRFTSHALSECIIVPLEGPVASSQDLPAQSYMSTGSTSRSFGVCCVLTW